MRDVYVIGSFSTAFGRWAAKDHRALAKDAVLGVLQDAELADGSALGQAYFGNCLMHMIGQTMIRGQTCLSDLMEQGVFGGRKTTRVGLAPTGKRRLFTAHTLTGHHRLSRIGLIAQRVNSRSPTDAGASPAYDPPQRLTVSY
jgi:acetyl-CoA acetyltransferase